MVLLVLPLLLGSCNKNGYPGDPPGLEISVAANEIIRALDMYKRGHSHYPDKLECLMPTYIKSIPIPTWGTKTWEYWVNEDGNYQLLVRLQNDRYERVWYSSLTGKWAADF